MAQETLVEDDKRIPDGAELCSRLRAVPGLRAEVVAWWYDLNREEWEYVVATPVVHEQGRIPAARAIREAAGDDLAYLLEYLHTMSPSESRITVLDIAAQGKVPIGKLLIGRAIQGMYIPGAYFYQFEPRSFAREDEFQRHLTR